MASDSYPNEILSTGASKIIYGIGGEGARDISATSGSLQGQPVTLFYNFPGLLGTTTYPIERMTTNRPGNFDMDGLQTWSDALNNKWNAPTTSISADQQSLAVSTYALNAILKNGIFTSLIPNTVDGYLFASSRNMDFNSISDKDVALPGESKFRDFIQGPIRAFNSLLTDTKSNQLNLQLANNHNNNVLILGPYSNGNISLGDGNNIVANSPAMFDASSVLWQRNASEPDKMAFWYFYPSMQGTAKSNSIQFGNGNNLVYFDSSVATISTGNGDNTFAPSFGSFNWARNDLQSQNYFTYSSGDPIYYMPPANKTTWFTPFTIDASHGGTINNPLYGRWDTYEIVTNQTRQTLSSPAKFTQATYVGGNFGQPNNPTDENGAPIKAKLPVIGGQIIKAGNGNDIFYGVDPNFYRTNGVSNSGITGADNRDVFIVPNQATKNERFSLQNFETITMLGGKGNDIFYLGNPTKLSPDGLSFYGDYSYKISTNHRFLATDMDRKKLAFEEKNAGTDIIEINLSTDVKTYTNTSQSFEPSTGENPMGAADLAKAAVSGYFTAADKFLDKFMAIGDSFKFMPLVNIGLSAISGVTSMIKIFTPKEPEPVVVDSTLMTQPLGQWRQVVEINDWNPGTVINIKVDPTITTAPNSARWSNVKFNTKAELSSTYGTGTLINWNSGSNPAQSLFYIDGFTSQKEDLAAYYSFNFNLGKYQRITEQNLDYFGNIAVGVNGINPLQNYTGKNGFVFSSNNPNLASMAPDGSYQFYWNDQNNSTINLDAARESARSLSIQFDSRSLGWYWQPEYTSTLPVGTTNPTEDQLKNSIAIDEAKSKLWVKDADDPTQWNYYTFADLKTKTMGFHDALLASTYYQIPNARGGLISNEQKQINSLVEDLARLDTVMPDLAKLQQNAANKVKLENLGQIIAVDQNGRNIDVYFIPDQSSGTVFKTTVKKVGNNVIASDPEAQSAEVLYALEQQSGKDVDSNGLVGTPALVALKSLQDNKSFVESLYKAILDRTPDDVGLNNWTAALNKGLDRKDIISAFLASHENEVLTPNSEFVEDLYVNILNRKADTHGMADWTGLLDREGVRADVVNAFFSSPEFIALVGLPHS